MVNIRGTVYQVGDVSPAWIRKEMNFQDVKVKDIALDTGVDQSSISSYISGSRGMSKPVKAMFLYYFKHKYDGI